MNSTSRQSPITVAHVVSSLEIGGLERIVVTLAKAANPEEFRVGVYSIGEEGELMNQVKSLCYETAAFKKGPGRDYLLPFHLARCFRKNGVDVVHCHNFAPFVYGGIAGKLARSRGIIYTIHGPDVPGRRLQSAFQRLPVASRVVAVSEFVRRRALEVRVRSAETLTILNGIDVAAYVGKDTQNMRAALGATEATVLLGIIARLTPEKDHATLIDAFSRVHAEGPSTRLIIVGDGALRDDLSDQVARAGLSSSVAFLGTRNDVAEILSAFDVFVLSSRQEGLGITLLEAMAASLPVVATGAGGIPEVVAHGETGLVVPPADPESLARAMLWMIRNRGEAETMGRRGRERVTAHFAAQKMVAEYENLYRQVVER